MRAALVLVLALACAVPRSVPDARTARVTGCAEVAVVGERRVEPHGEAWAAEGCRRRWACWRQEITGVDRCEEVRPRVLIRRDPRVEKKGVDPRG